MKEVSRREVLFYRILASALLFLAAAYLTMKQRPVGPLTVTGFALIALFSIALVLCTFKKAHLARYLAIEFSLCLGILLLAEAALRIADFPPDRDSERTQISEHRLAALISLKEKGLKATPHIPADTLREVCKGWGTDLCLSGIGNAFIVGYEEDDGVPVFKSDSNGFRNPAGLYEENKRLDVFLLGDSFTEGSCVPDGFTVADYLRKDTGLSVYNAGYGGNGLVSELGIFLEYGLRKKPKNLVLILVESVSLARISEEVKNDSLNKYLQYFSPLGAIDRNAARDRKLEDFAQVELAKELLKCQQEHGRVKFKLKLLLFARDYLLRRYRGEGYPDCANLSGSAEIARKVFAYYKGITASYDGKFLVVYLPDTRFYIKNWPDCERQAIKELCLKEHIDFVDMTKVFEASGNPKIFFARNRYNPALGGHCNRLGYEVIAQEIAREIRR